MTAAQTSPNRETKTARLGLRATPEQEMLLRRAAEVSRKSLTEFILDSAYKAAEETLLDQRLFLIDDERYQRLLEMLDRTPADNSGLRDLFAKKAPWDEK
jgi:uncharacterized protein (DUF1778 family)